jgi:hypothetical protein
MAVDYEKSLVTVDGPLPTGLGGCGCLVYFSRDAYSRNAPYFVGGVRAAPSGSRLDLAGASLVLAHGRVSSDISKDGVFANAVPLDRERVFGRKTRTRYFDGKAIRNLRTGAVGRIKNSDLDSRVALDVNPGLRNGDRFDLLDVQAGDTFSIPAVIVLSQTAPDEWMLRSNVPVAVSLPDGTQTFNPAAGASEWRLKATTRRD